MEAWIISVGTELTVGLTVDTNAAWLAGEMAAVGFPPSRHVTVPDDRAAIRDAIHEAAGCARVVVVTGGLGPTGDDLTREGLADAARRPLVFDERSFDPIRAYFQAIQRTMPHANRRQAFLPQGATAIENTCGTAPGIRMELGDAFVFALPGVPAEMMEMFARSVRPELLRRSAGAAMVARTIRCFGASEARVAEMIDDLMAPGREPTVGITAQAAVISVRIMARGSSRESAASAAAHDLGVVRARLGDLVFGEDDTTLPQAVATLLLSVGRTVSVAESCTGGLLAKMLTDVPGSSGYFLGGFITYANQTKIDLLGVPASLIADHGAVSEQVAAAMAESCRRKLQSDIGLSTTGIAGPTGGAPEKPVGLVHIGLSDASGTITRRLLIHPGLGRSVIRDRACKATLNLLRRHLLGVLEPESG